MSELNWQKSSYSAEAANCLNVAAADGSVHIRESDDPGVVVTTTPDKWQAFVLAVKDGEFDDIVG